MACCVLIFPSRAQSTRKCVNTFLQQQSFKLDTLLIDPASISTDPEVGFEYHADTQSIRFDTLVNLTVDSVKVCYRVPNPLLYTPYFSRSINIYNSSRTLINTQTNATPSFSGANGLFQIPGLQQNGSITRGVTIGNRQNLFVNASLNLALEGQLTEDLSISAVITDRNVPYQPEGNTQQLRDFDNVYIQLYNQWLDLKVGDVVLENPISDSHFLKFYKNVRGARASVTQKIGDHWTSRTTLAASAAKGRFASISVDPLEGVQGPYRLRGPDDERFIIVLANSERVFVDGKRLERGFKNDYVIDYNLGEVTFNTNVVITRFTRITVDFEFTEQNYGRSNLAFAQELTHKQHQVYLSFYRERDNRNNTLGFDFSESALDELANLGDNLDEGFLSGVDSTGFFPERIQYARKDTTVAGQLFEIFEVSQDPERAVFSLRFTQLGSNQGNYRLVASTANGRTFEWIAPVEGVPQGDFEPVVQLAAPNQRQMTVFGSKSNFGKLRFNQELAWSHRDNNLFSPMDDGDNQGIAWKGGLKTDTLFSIFKNYHVTLFTDLEYTGRDFQAIDRFRYIEFDRDWSFTPSDTTNQWLTRSGIQVRKNAKQFAKYQFESRNRGEVFSGNKNTLEIREKLGPVRIFGDYFLMRSDQSTTRSEWERSETRFTWNTRLIKPGYSFRTDQNQVLSSGADSIIRSAMNFREHMFFLEQSDSSKWLYRLAYSHRKDRLPQMGELVDFTKANNFLFTLSSGGTQKVQLDFNYRETRDQINQETVDQLQGRLTTTNRFLDNHIRNNMSLAISSGRELEREFIYVAVNTGEGTHTWRDENMDGIQDLNEFYEAVNPDERQYIKLFTPTDEYITAFRNQYVHTLDISMPRHWKKRRGLKKALSRVSYLINFNLDNKTSNTSIARRLNPYAAFQDDEEVISRRNRSRYTLFYNRTAAGLGLQFAYQALERRQLNTNGFEAQNEARWLGKVRLNLGEVYSVSLGAESARIDNSSDFLSSRNFELNTWEIDPSLTWQPSRQFRIIGTYLWANKENLASEGEGENVRATEWKGEVTYSRVQKGNLTTRLSLINNRFEGEANSFLGYTLLNGLQPGQNLVINLNWQQQLIDGLQMTMQYFGRKSGSDRMVHTGTFQLTAFF